MNKNDCQYCQHSYIAGDEILCLGFNEPVTCEDYEPDEYWLEPKKDGEKAE